MQAIGCLLLAVSTVAALVVLLVSWQLHGRHPTLEHGVLLCFALSHFYAAATLLVGAVLPLRTLYERPDLVEMLHRSRYLVFDCMALPSVFWLLSELVLRSKDEPLLSAAAVVMEEPCRSVTLFALAAIHCAMAGMAAMDCARYPFHSDNSLGIMYSRPARFTERMKRPWHWTIRALWVMAIYRCVVQRRAWLLLATGAFHFAFNGHMSPYKYNPWEIFVQPLATAMLCGALLRAADVALQCDWRSLDPTRCLVVSPRGAVPLFAGATSLRF